MSDRQTHDDKCEATGSNYIVYCRCTERRLERQRDAAVEALKTAAAYPTLDYELAVHLRKVLREIEGES